MIPFAVLVPIPLLAFGVINQFVDGKLVGLTGCLICLFFNGLGVSSESAYNGIYLLMHANYCVLQVEMAFGPCAAYLVDVMHSRSAESLAANG